jgi:hypothetical protein
MTGEQEKDQQKEEENKDITSERGKLGELS